MFTILNDIFMEHFIMIVHFCFGSKNFFTSFAIAADLEEGEEARIPGGLREE